MNMRKGKFKIFPFFQVKKDNKGLKDAYEDYFIEKFQPSLNVLTEHYAILCNIANPTSL